MLRPQFFRSEYASLDLFREQMNDLLDCIPKQSSIIDLQDLFYKFTLDTTSSFLFGESLCSLKGPSAGETYFAEAFHLAQDYLARRYRLGKFYWLMGGIRFRTACSTVHRFVDEVIKRSSRVTQHTKPKRYVFFDEVARETLDRRVLREYLLNILLAGK